MSARHAGTALAVTAIQGQSVHAAVILAMLVTLHVVSSPGRRDDLTRSFSPRQIELLEKLNRADREALARLRRLVVPDQWRDDELAYSPLPDKYPAAEIYPKWLVVVQSHQVFGAYESGRLVRWGPVSSGRKSAPTPSGQFHLNWRSKGRQSTIDPDWFMPWYFNFENFLGLSLHQYSLPGTPSSHSCIRLLERDAVWLFSWGVPWTLDAAGRVEIQQGTPLLIVGRYDFERPPPWLDAAMMSVELPLDADGLQ